MTYDTKYKDQVYDHEMLFVDFECTNSSLFEKQNLVIFAPSMIQDFPWLMHSSFFIILIQLDNTEQKGFWQKLDLTKGYLITFQML